MEHEPLEQARAELCALPGVGRKTAACVLLFSFGRHDVPVDTHVHRVGTRLGLFRPGAPLEECHDELLRLSADEDPYESHMALIRHGRRLCRARSPRCGECPLRRMCPYARGELSKAQLRAGRHRRRLGPDVRDGPGRHRGAAHDGLPGLPLRLGRPCSWR